MRRKRVPPILIPFSVSSEQQERDRIEDLRQEERDSLRTPEGIADAKRRIVLGVAMGQEKGTVAVQNLVKIHELESWERADGDFAQDLDNAFKLGTSRLVDRAYQRAFNDSDRLMELLLAQRDPDRFGEKAEGSLKIKPLSDMTVGELERHIGTLRAMEKEAGMTIDGTAVETPREE